MDFDEISGNIQGFEKELAELKAKFSASIQRQMTEMFKSFFLEDEECVRIEWTQYTPYFNDGDPCVFRVHEPQYFSQDAEVDEDNYGEGDLHVGGRLETNELGKYHLVPGTKAEARRAKLSEIITGPGIREILLTAFGDHADITVTAEGINVEGYDHE